jgi:hypothetical protein
MNISQVELFLVLAIQAGFLDASSCDQPASPANCNINCNQVDEVTIQLQNALQACIGDTTCGEACRNELQNLVNIGNSPSLSSCEKLQQLSIRIPLALLLCRGA